MIDLDMTPRGSVLRKVTDRLEVCSAPVGGTTISGRIPVGEAR